MAVATRNRRIRSSPSRRISAAAVGRTVSGRSDRGETTRRRILEASLQILGERGRRGLTARAVAERAGVSKGTLFHHFATLDAIPLAAAERLVTEITESVDAAAYRDARGYLRALGPASLRLVEENAEAMKALNVYLGEAFFDEEYREAVTALFTSALGEIRAGLATHADNAVPRARLDAVALSVTALLDGMTLHALLLGDSKPFHKAWRVAADAFAATLDRGERRS